MPLPPHRYGEAVSCLCVSMSVVFKIGSMTVVVFWAPCLSKIGSMAVVFKIGSMTVVVSWAPCLFKIGSMTGFFLDRFQ